MSRLNVYENANNNRNSWNRNESQLGEVIFGVEYESPGIPKVRECLDPGLSLGSLR